MLIWLDWEGMNKCGFSCFKLKVLVELCCSNFVWAWYLIFIWFLGVLSPFEKWVLISLIFDNINFWAIFTSPFLCATQFSWVFLGIFFRRGFGMYIRFPIWPYFLFYYYCDSIESILSDLGWLSEFVMLGDLLPYWDSCWIYNPKYRMVCDFVIIVSLFHFSYPTLALVLLIIFVKLVVATHEHMHVCVMGSCKTWTHGYRLVERLFIWGLGWELPFPMCIHCVMSMGM